MAVALPEISTPRPPARVGHYAREVFRYPVIPVAVLVIVLLIPALAANWLAPYDPLKGDMTNRFAEPSAQHWFGTDDIGRDVLSRVMHGARVSLLVASVAILISGLIGTSFGIVSAYYGGWADNLMMRLVDISLSLPIIVVAIVVAAMAGPSMKILIAVLVLSQWSSLCAAGSRRSADHTGAGLHLPGPGWPEHPTSGSCSATSSRTS